MRHNIDRDEPGLDGTPSGLEVFADDLVSSKFDVEPNQNQREHGKEGTKAYDHSPAGRLGKDRCGWVKERRLIVILMDPKHVDRGGRHFALL